MKTVEQTLMEHQRKSQDIAIRLLNVGKDESSALIKYKVKINEKDEIAFDTTITLFPLRRIYKNGEDTIVDNKYLIHEIEEDKL